jgi:hypothetical protein
MYLTILFYTYLYSDKDENCAHSVQEEFDVILFYHFTKNTGRTIKQAWFVWFWFIFITLFNITLNI